MHPKITYISKIIIDNTNYHDPVLYYPLLPEVYTETGRFPGSYYYFLLPWVTDRHGTISKVSQDIEANKVKLIIIDDTEKIVNKYKPRIFLKDLIEFLNSNDNYENISSDKNIYIFKRKN